jgi:hypothetical protein
MRNSQVPGMNGYLVGPIVGPDRAVDGSLKQPRQLRVRGTDPLLIKRTDSIAHRFGPERHSTSNGAKIPLVAIDLAGRERRRQLMDERRSASSTEIGSHTRPASGRTASSGMSWVTTTSSAAAAADRRLSGPRGHFFVRPDSVPLLKLPTESVGDIRF